MTGDAHFRRLYREHATAVWGYVLRRSANDQDCLDVVSETFLVLWRRLDETPPDSEVRPWLIGVARRVLANQRRGRLRRTRLDERLRGSVLSDVGALRTEPSTTALAVELALGALDSDDQELLRLSAWEQLTPSEIAVVLDIPASTARTRLSRARSRARDALVAAGLGVHDTHGTAGPPDALRRSANSKEACHE